MRLIVLRSIFILYRNNITILHKKCMEI